MRTQAPDEGAVRPAVGRPHRRVRGQSARRAGRRAGARRAGARRAGARRVDAHRLADLVVVNACRLAAALPLAGLVFVVVALALKAAPAISFNGFGFLTRKAWNPGDLYSAAPGVRPPGASYGALPLIAGTVASSLVALVLAVPVSIGAALIVVRKLPARVSSVVGVCLEVLAGVPSVVYGLWGVLVLGPILARDVAPVVSRHAPNIPPFAYLRGDTGFGEGLFTSGVVLAVMIVPIIASTTRELLRQVPEAPREGARALGLTESEIVRRVDLPWVSSGIIGASVLGLGRALGETMAVAMVSGTVLGTYPHNLYATMSTIAATIVSQLDSALTDASGLAVQTLAEVGLVLMVISLAVNVTARMLVRRVAVTALPVGRGV